MHAAVSIVLLQESCHRTLIVTGGSKLVKSINNISDSKIM